MQYKDLSIIVYINHINMGILQKKIIEVIVIKSEDKTDLVRNLLTKIIITSIITLIFIIKL